MSKHPKSMRDYNRRREAEAPISYCIGVRGRGSVGTEGQGLRVEESRVQRFLKLALQTPFLGKEQSAPMQHCFPLVPFF